MYTRDQILKAVKNCLDESERKVIISRFGIEDGITRSLSEIQTCLGVSREQVREIEKKVLNYIKEYLS
ncbi:MAG: sigma factor-like helix-turn-helix DNA-binding protein [Desulfitobacteriaceae bacterium]|nr:sigma factor-like helix-turn-helix DNA-binding protein [Clostridia bacterium]MDD4346341.1 sigma factor-like helix-turn-helix DNA-binding protein [Desulfitobacteriaceae bacterium]MDD4400567.1 sigma factor-like helix-turn-helix DNA-binding protein [Desulfitobacteriaceae bacterium]